MWKAPAGIDAGLTGESGLQYVLTDLQNGNLNIQAINCLRQFKVYGDVVWGARTLRGNDQAGSQWKYVPIRRLALFLESSLYDGTQWVVFEPNDERLWGQIRLNVGAFMQGLFLQGAFQGTTPQQAYFVKCDAENNPQSSIDLGIVNILVGFAPLYPAEFVVIQIQQMAGSDCKPKEAIDGHTVSGKSEAPRSVQEFQVPPEVGRQVCVRRQQGDRAEAHDGGGGASQRRRSLHRRTSRPAAPSTKPSRWSAA